METKYFTPSIGELFVGYECEMRTASTLEYPEPVWGKFVFGSISVDHYNKVLSTDGFIRTPFLSSEGIESLGWNYERNGVHGLTKVYSLNGYNLWFPSSENIMITDDDSLCIDSYYAGPCKSKNELKKLMEWLNIK